MTGAAPWAAHFGSTAWHVHELIFGAVGAVIAGFLLSAVPNWTGRRPIAGVPLAVLFALWLAGRIAMLAVAPLDPATLAFIDALFPTVLAMLLFREIVLGAGRHSAKIAVLFTGFAIADIGFHAEALTRGVPEYSVRAAIAIVIALIIVIVGRIIPAFTGGNLAGMTQSARPAQYGRLDSASLAVAGVALALWIALPVSPLTAGILILAAAMHALRLFRWRGWAVRGTPLLLVMHVAYAFVPLGFLLLGTSLVWSDAPVAAIHAWTAGAMGLMTLGVMARAALGHAGRAIAAGPGLVAIFLAGFVAAVVRIAAPLGGRGATTLLLVSAMCWIGAFAGFALWLAPLLLRVPASTRWTDGEDADIR